MMTRDFLMASIAALGLSACGPDLTTDSKPSATVGGAPAQPAAAGTAGGGDPAAALAERQTAAADTKEDKESGEKKQ